MSGRTFVVTVSEAPNRVVVEDVRGGRRVVAEDLAAVGEQISKLLDVPQRQGRHDRERHGHQAGDRGTRGSYD